MNKLFARLICNTRKTRSKETFIASLPLFVVVLILSSCDSENSTSSAVTKVEWESCADRPVLECGTLEVPVDYNNTEGEKIKLALTRLPSTGDARLGHLVMNPGGPGDSGVQLVYDLEQGGTVPDEIRDVFHLLSFDPRGVAASGTLDCARDLESQYNGYPVGREALADTIVVAQSMTDICVEKYGDYLQHLGSNNVVRDMEEIRKSIEDAQLHFIGYSYGTRLASVYLELFPDTVGKLVLDAVLPPEVDAAILMKDRVAERQNIFQLWLSNCAAINPDCDPQVIGQSLTLRFNDLLAATDSPDPITADLAQEESELFSNFVTLVVAQPGLGEFTLESFILYAENNDIEVLRQLKLEFDTLAGGDIFGLGDEDSNMAVFRSIACADDPTRPTLDSLLTLSEDANVISDLFAESVMPIASACSGWPESIDPVPALTQPSSGRSLLIGGIADDETPLVWAQQLAQATEATLIVSEHLGHTVTFTGKSNCVDQAVTVFLTSDDAVEAQTCSSDM